MTKNSAAKLMFGVILLPALVAAAFTATAQSPGTAGTVTGVVTDPNGAVVPNASVTISNPVTGYTRTANADADGSFRFNDVPPNNYHVTVSAAAIRSTAPAAKCSAANFSDPLTPPTNAASHEGRGLGPIT